MIDKRKKMISAAVWLLLILAAVLLVFFKLELTGNQMVEGYFSSYAPIDDTLMYDSAVSISKGEWLGEYSWKTLSKHMFFSVWLAALSELEIPYLQGGQLLYLVACIAAAWAVAPLFKRKQWCVPVFAALWMSPYSWAQFTLRVYRDNIFPSLCLLFFAGMLGFGLRLKERAWKSIGFALLAGLGLGTAWLTREDGVWLLPFAICAALAYLIVLLLQKQFTLRQKLARAAMPALSLAVCLVCIGLYCWQNYTHYGRFIVSDFTSSEFEDAVGALLRCDTDGVHEQKILVCKQTRDKVAAAVPLYAEIEQVIAENPALYGGYGFPETEEFNSGGFYWALRVAVSEAGYYADAVTARNFYRELADAINAACDSGALEHSGGKKSTTVMPWHSAYLSPTLGEFGNSVRCLLGFEQTTGLAGLSTAPQEQAEEMKAFLHNDLSTMVSPDTGAAMYTVEQRDAEMQMRKVTRIYQALIIPMLALALMCLGVWIARAIREMRKKQTGAQTLGAILFLGVFLSILLRIGIVSYIEAVSFQIGTYLLYLSSAGPLILLFAAAGTAGAFEIAAGWLSGFLKRKKPGSSKAAQKT